MSQAAKLVDSVSKKYQPEISRLIRDGRLDPKEMNHLIHSENASVRKNSRATLKQLIGAPRLYIKTPKTTTKTSVAQKVPLLDLMKRPSHQGKRNQFQLLKTLVLINKDFNKVFTKSLKQYEKDIKSIVSLCHFFDLTRQYPNNDFKHRVGLNFILDDPKIGFKSRREYTIYLENNQFHLVRHDYSDGNVQTREFPNTKEGFIQLLDEFVPILKSSVFASGLHPYWNHLRPLTPFDKKMLKRFGIVQNQTVRQILDPAVFKINPETISYWDMSYLDNLSDDEY